MTNLLISTPRDVFRDALAHGVLTRHGAKKVYPARPQLSGFSCDGDHSRARILEYAMPDGEIVGRLVEACGRIETWLREDIATDTLIARADAVAEVERIKRLMTDSILADRRRRQEAPEPAPLSSALIHAAARHQSRIGRLHDKNSRGDAVRGQLVQALQRAAKSEGQS